MIYQVPQHIDKDKIFIVKKSEIEGRLEPNFYRPSIATLEKKIRSLSSKRLRSYAQSFAGGATPSKRESEKYYSDSQIGIPFLRVQNLQTDGELSLNGCIYINEETHNGLLKRSQVSGGDLLVKITGVGRMAIASVAPEDFAGNTNQHMVVIKTGNHSVSKYLAHYLNLDIIEQIASRHSTGGTRPALDYPSLKNIPIIEGLDFSIIDNAIIEKKAKEVEAQQLLDSIDGYLLKELGITIPDIDNELNNRIFFSSFSKVEGNRIDPKKYSTKVRNLCAAIQNADYEIKELNRFIVDICSGDWGIEDCEDYNRDTHIRCLTLRGTEIDNQYNISINNDKAKTRLIKIDTYRKMSIAAGDIIIEKSGGSEDQPVGRVAFIDNELLELYNIGFSNFLFKFKVKDINPQYLYLYLKTMYNIGVTDSMQSQTNGIRNLIVKEFLSQIVVKPPFSKQQEIVDCITNIRTRAKALQAEGKAILENAKRKVEQMIIGE